MDESETIIGSIREGLLEGVVWQDTIDDVEGSVAAFSVELRTKRGDSLLLALWQLPDLASVMTQALDCVREYADDAIKSDLTRLLTALRAAEKPRHPRV